MASYDETKDEGDLLVAVLGGAHNRALLLASRIMATPMDFLHRLDPADEQSLEDACGDLRAVARFVEAALKRTWESGARCVNDRQDGRMARASRPRVAR